MIYEFIKFTVEFQYTNIRTFSAMVESLVLLNFNYFTMLNAFQLPVKYTRVLITTEVSNSFFLEKVAELRAALSSTNELLKHVTLLLRIQ